MNHFLDNLTLQSESTIQISLLLGYNDLIFQKLDCQQRDIFRKLGVYYSVYSPIYMPNSVQVTDHRDRQLY